MYDLIVIGGGWAGFSAAEYAARNGLRTALIEKDSLGGTCLNYGCIPTKTLLNSAKLFTQIKKSSKLAINTESASIDLIKLKQRKDDIVSRLRSSLEFLIKINKIDFFNSDAKIVSPNEVRARNEVLQTKYILIATGSKPKELPSVKFDGQKVISSTEALNLTSLPGKILIIGGGVIGCEFADFFSSCGVSMEIAELTENLLPGVDKEVAKKLETVFKKRGIKLLLKTDVSALNLNSYDKILLCVGRAASVDSFEGLNINTERGRILVNEYMQTGVPNIYGAGDCIGGYLLAHVASYEGRLAVENILHKNSKKANYKAVPSAIFTNPEIAAVGLSEEDARKNHKDIEIKKLDFLKLGMSCVIDETDGFIKIITDGQENILGASIIGPKATELIHVLTLAIHNSLKASQIRDTIFAHPTISEGIAEALL